MKLFLRDWFVRFSVKLRIAKDKFCEGKKTHGKDMNWLGWVDIVIMHAMRYIGYYKKENS